MKRTLLERYGVDNLASIPEVRDKIRSTTLKNHGVTAGVSTKKSIRNAHTKDAQMKREQTTYDHYGVKSYLMTRECRLLQRKVITKPNIKVHDLLLEKGIDTSYEKKVEDKFYDLNFKDTLIEINPSISHNSDFTYGDLIGTSKNSNNRDINSHYDRYKIAIDNGYNLVSIFDWFNISNTIEFIDHRYNKDFKDHEYYTYKLIPKNRADSFIRMNYPYKIKICNQNIMIYVGKIPITLYTFEELENSITIKYICHNLNYDFYNNLDYFSKLFNKSIFIEVDNNIDNYLDYKAELIKQIKPKEYKDYVCNKYVSIYDCGKSLIKLI